MSQPERRRPWVGDYRVVYTIDNGELVVWVADVIDKHVHPEAHPEAYDDLLARAKESPPDDVTMAQFKTELIRALTGDTEGLHPDAIFVAAAYDDGSHQAFLRRLWTELYPDEPTPQHRTSGLD